MMMYHNLLFAAEKAPSESQRNGLPLKPGSGTAATREPGLVTTASAEQRGSLKSRLKAFQAIASWVRTALMAAN